MRHRENPEILKDRISELVKKYGEKNFADKIGVQRSTVRGWTSGKRTVNTESLYDICKIFRVEPNWLYGIGNYLDLSHEAKLALANCGKDIIESKENAYNEEGWTYNDQDYENLFQILNHLLMKPDFYMAIRCAYDSVSHDLTFDNIDYSKYSKRSIVARYRECMIVIASDFFKKALNDIITDAVAHSKREEV